MSEKYNYANSQLAHPSTGARRAKSRRPVVLQVLPSLWTGGVEQGTVDIAEAIVKAGGIALVASSGGPRVHDCKRVGAQHLTLPAHSKNPLVMHRNVARIEKIIRDYGVDIVHARSRAPAWSARAAAKRGGAHFITTFHGTYNASNSLKRTYNSIMTTGERVIAISDFIAGHLQAVYGVRGDRIRIVPRGIDLTRFDPRGVSAERQTVLATNWRLPDGMPVVMLPGRLTRWKGQEVIIKAMALLDRRELRCLLVGSDQGRTGYRAELERKIAENGLSSIIQIVDHCADMPAVYMLSDVVVSASIEPEAFGRVAAEAHAMGRPVVATNHGGARETVLNGVTGKLVHPGNAQELAAAIEEALALSPEARAEQAQTAMAHVRQNFTKESMCRKTLAVYNEVLDEGFAFELSDAA
jgi:glycosyltransferase involved in cell wall biosynthesis